MITKEISFYIILLLNILKAESLSNNEIDKTKNLDWDVLVFSQQWPVTTCYHWMEMDKSNTCNLPNQKEFWTIHGLWPTKLGTSGPSFCNHTLKFDLNKLKEIENELELFWPDIQTPGHKYDLWKHEWVKHGSCAATLSIFDTELKYFNKSLNLRTEYLISEILSNSGIHPDSQNTVINYQNAFKKYLNKNPSIHCIYDRKTNTSFLAEIRICFNKTLDIIDCDGISGNSIPIDYPAGTVNTNCHISKLISYPSNLPPINSSSWKFPFVNIYKLINFIMWFTL